MGCSINLKWPKTWLSNNSVIVKLITGVNALTEFTATTKAKIKLLMYVK